MSNTTPNSVGVNRNLTGLMAASMPFSLTPGTTSTPTQVPTPEDVGLSTTKTCSDHDDVATVVTPLIGERFALSDAQRTKLQGQLSIYFVKSGVTNEEILSFMTDPASWPVPSTIADDGAPLNLITVPVTLLLAKIAKYTSLALEQSFYLSSKMNFKDVQKWGASFSSGTTTNTTNTTTSSTKGNDDHKIPSFKVPAFHGDTLNGDKYIEDVVRAFCSNAMSKYLDDKAFCSVNLAWSGAFASRIRESVASNDILGFLATELESENICAEVWETVQPHLSFPT